MCVWSMISAYCTCVCSASSSFPPHVKKTSGVDAPEPCRQRPPTDLLSCLAVISESICPDSVHIVIIVMSTRTRTVLLCMYPIARFASFVISCSPALSISTGHLLLFPGAGYGQWAPYSKCPPPPHPIDPLAGKACVCIWRPGARDTSTATVSSGIQRPQTKAIRIRLARMSSRTECSRPRSWLAPTTAALRLRKSS